MDKHLFADLSHAAKYAEKRPKVPPVVAQVIVDFMKEKMDEPRFDLLVDIGCGSGQSTAIFAPHFVKALGVDPSESQIMFAAAKNQCENVEFQVAAAEALPVPSSSASSLVAMTAAHWFDLDRFYDECRRVLVPGGALVLGVTGYFPDFTSMKRPIWSDSDENAANTKKLQRLVDEFGHSLDWSPRIQHFLDKYRNLPMPGDDFEIKRHEDCSQDVSWNLQDLMAFLTTWSGYNSFMAKNPQSNILKKLEEDLGSVLGEKKDDEFCFLDQYFLIMMRRL